MTETTQQGAGGKLTEVAEYNVGKSRTSQYGGRFLFVNADGVVYEGPPNDSPDQFFMPSDGYGIVLLPGHRLDALAPYLCGHCGNDRLQIIHTDDYETSGRCPACGFEAIVHDG